MDINQLRDDLDTLATQATEELAAATSREDAIQIKNSYLGRKGRVADLMKVLRELPNDQKREAGHRR